MSATVVPPASPPLLRMLAEKSLLPPEKVEQISRQRGQYGSLEETVIAVLGITEADVVQCHAQHLGIPAYGWGKGEGEIVEIIDGKEPERIGTVEELALSLQAWFLRLTETACRRRIMAPVALADGRLTVACADPLDIAALEEARMRTGLVVEPRPAPPTLVHALLQRAFGARDEVREIASEAEPAKAAAKAEGAEDQLENVVDLQRPVPQSKDSQVIRIVNVLLATAIEERASDIHLEPYETAVRVRYRIDGELVPTTPPPRSLFLPTISRLKILAKMDIAERRIPQDGAISLKNGEHRVDLRVSTVPTVYGEKMVIRILEKKAIPNRLEALGFGGLDAERFMEAVRSPHGLVFVTGPTGSGKSTTLYCALTQINEPNTNIVTVEDPVEYRFMGLNQVNVNTKSGLTFASSLRSFLRQDPDVIMVGEVRDQETAGICMRAALTGHLVISTLHTNDALQVINRLVDMGIEPFLLGPALRLLQAQRLARRLCAACKQPRILPEDVARKFGLEPEITICRPGGGDCKVCRGVGYKGRVGLYEVVQITDKLREMICTRAPVKDVRKCAREEGMTFLSDSARAKVREGLTSLEEVSEYLFEE